MTVSIRASLMLSALAMAALTAAFVDAPDDAKPAADKPQDHEAIQAPTEPAIAKPDSERASVPAQHSPSSGAIP